MANLPKQAKIIATGINLEELLQHNIMPLEFANVIFNVSGTKAILQEICQFTPCLEWIHSMSAGVDHILFHDLVHNPDITLTNAKGVFSKSLAEYTVASMLYFAKDVIRLNKQKEEKKWEKFCVKEIRYETLGIIGYGDIGRECAKLAKAFGMRIVALRRRPNLSSNDDLIDKVYGPDQIIDIVKESDYLLLVTPLTAETHHMINADVLKHCKQGQVLINIGRGKLIDEKALIAALKSRETIVGAALDVFATEPLPVISELWSLPNVLISPHCADMTVDFRHQSTRFFCENCERFVTGKELLCVVDKSNGY